MPNGTDFCFVAMPYLWPKMPSFAMGLLQAILERDGLRAKSLYGSILFWDELGYERFSLVSRNLESMYWVGAWTFAHVAFPDFHPDDEAFLSAVHPRCDPAGRTELEHFKEVLLSIRELAGRFVDRLAQRILDDGARIVGCSVPFQSQHVASLALLRRLREWAPDVVTVMGGSNCETVTGLTTHKRFPWVDYVVSGEADEIITPLARAILEHGRNIPMEKLPEAVFAPVHRAGGYPWDADGRPEDAPRAVARSLDGLPTPNYEDFFSAFNASAQAKSQILPGLPYETSRGCWWGRCRFCGLNGRRVTYRSRSVPEVLRDLDLLSRRHQVRKFEVVDNILDTDYFPTLLADLARAGAPYNLFYETKSDLTREQIKALRDAGVRWIQPGIESLHSAVLKLMRKGCKAYQNVELLKWARQYGVRTQWSILFDFPGEKDEWYEEMAQMLPLFFHLSPPFAFVAVHFHRYSDYHRRPEEYGLKLRVPEMLRYVYPLDAKELQDIIYDFEEESRECLRRDAVLSALLSRESIETIGETVLQWIKLFWSDNRPALGMTVTESDIAIRDTRPVAVESSSRLVGLERDLYLACEEAKKPNDLYRRFVAGDVTRKRVDGVIQDLVDRRLMIRIDGRLLGLAVREPCEAFLEENDFPGGAVIEPIRTASLSGALEAQDHSPSRASTSGDGGRNDY